MNFNKYNGNTEQETYLMKKAIQGGGPGPTPGGSKMYLHTIKMVATWSDPMEGIEMGELDFDTQLTLSRPTAFTRWDELVDELITHGHDLLGSGTYEALASSDPSGFALKVLGSEQTMVIKGIFDDNYGMVEKAVDDDASVQVYDYVMEA